MQSAVAGAAAAKHAPAPNRPVVVLERITKRFGPVVAVDNLDLVVEQGEMLSLLGPSGCGKTTTLRIVAGLEQPTNGGVSIGGVSMAGVPSHRRNLGLVPQNYALFPHLTVFDNVAFGLKMRRVPRSDVPGRVRRALDLVRLQGLEERMPRQLSGGQQQRVALARAIVIEPTVLLLDEPLGALDKKLREEMQVELKQLQSRVGVTTMFVTHDQEEALTLSDRVVVMSQGRIQQAGTPKALYERPTSHFVADFLGVSNFLAGRVTGSSAGTVEVETAAGWRLVALHDGGGLSAGQTVELSFRPEKVALSTDEPSATNRARGLVESIVYLGSSTHYRVSLPTGETLVAYAQNVAPLPIEQGESVWASWQPEHTHVLPLDGSDRSESS